MKKRFGSNSETLKTCHSRDDQTVPDITGSRLGIPNHRLHFHAVSNGVKEHS